MTCGKGKPARHPNLSRPSCLTTAVSGGTVRRMMPLFVFGCALASVVGGFWEDHKRRKARKALR